MGAVKFFSKRSVKYLALGKVGATRGDARFGILFRFVVWFGIGCGREATFAKYTVYIGG